MPATTHLKSLQALDLALRLGSFKAAADRMNITPAAVGQRIRALEIYLGADLLRRGRSGLRPTPELEPALGDLHAAFSALDRVTETLDFQRVSEIQVVADIDWAELWLAPRLAKFREANPHILLCVNGVGDAPFRLGPPDIRVIYGEGPDEVLFTDILLPLTGPDNLRRIAGSQPDAQMEGMPLLHLKSQLEAPDRPGWVEWFRAYGNRKAGPARGVRYPLAHLALEAARAEVGFLLCGYSLIAGDLAAGRIVPLFPTSQNLPATHPYRLRIRPDSEKRPQVRRFADWLRAEAAETRYRIRHIAAG